MAAPPSPAPSPSPSPAPSPSLNSEPVIVPEYPYPQLYEFPGKSSDQEPSPRRKK